MGKVYAASDFHGNKVAFKLLDYLQPDDKLYFLGDAVDRGPYGIELIHKLLVDPRVIYLEGNHEELMLNAIASNGGSMAFHWREVNGGNITWETLCAMYPTQENRLKFAKELENKMKYGAVTYINKDGKEIILEHAGFTPWGMPYRHHDPLWDRDHFFDNYNIEGENKYVIHGHTPIQYLRFYYGYAGQGARTPEDLKLKIAFERDELKDWKPTILRYCEGHKFDIDMCTIDSERIALLDLDTFEEIYFDKE